MGSKEKFFGIITADHGFDDIGFAQSGGSITSIERYGGAGKWRKMALVTTSAAHGLTRGQQINITSTITEYNGPAIVLDVVSTTKLLVKKPYTIGGTGTFDGNAGEGNWSALMPIGADLPTSNIAMLSWKPDEQGGNEISQPLTKDKVYPIPGGIRKVTISNSGDVRLFRAASLRPGGVKGLIAPTVAYYSPTGATAGDSVDILGSGFDPALSNNSVHFIGGGTATVVYPTAIDPEGHWMTVPFPSGVINTTGAFRVKTNGMLGATGPSFNIR